MIDDHIVTVGNILLHEFVDPILERVNHQLILLKFFQELYDEWMTH